MSGSRADSSQWLDKNAKELYIYEFLAAFTTYFSRYGIRSPQSQMINYHAQLASLVNMLATDPSYKTLFETKKEQLDLLQEREEEKVKDVVTLTAAKEKAEELRNIIYQNLRQNPPTLLTFTELASLDQELLDLDYRRFYPYFLCCLASLEIISIHQAANRPTNLIVRSKESTDSKETWSLVKPVSSPPSSQTASLTRSKQIGPKISQVTPGLLTSGSMWTRLNDLGGGIRKATGVLANLASHAGIPSPSRKS